MKHKNSSLLYRVILPAAAIIISLCVLAGCGGAPAATSTPASTTQPVFTTTTPATTATVKTTEPSSLTVLSISGGDVEVQKKGKTAWEKGREGMTLEPGDKIRTAAGGQALITFFEGSTVDIQDSTEISLEEIGIKADQSTTIRMKQEIGKTISRVKKLMDSGDRFEIETPSAVAAVRGSTMFVGVAITRVTSVGNMGGKITVTAMGKEVTLPENTHTTVNPGEPPANPEPGATPAPTTTVSPTTSPTTTVSPTTSPTTTVSPTTTPSPTPVVIRITSLQPGDLVGQSVVVSGIVSDPTITEGIITVNGEAGSIEIINGTFSVTVTLQPGNNLIVVSVTKDGFTAEASAELESEEPQ